MRLIGNLKTWKTKVIALFAVVALFFVSSCKCDDASNPSCPNYDPCLCVSPNFGDFYMEERLFYNGEGEFIKTDTTLELNDIRFSLYDENVDSVKWFIGADPTERIEKSFVLFFEEAYGDIEITAIAYKKSATSCFGEQGGIDTVTKTLHVLEWWQAPYFGTFRGSTSVDPNTIFETKIDTISNDRGTGNRYRTTLLTNFPNGYSMPIPVDGSQNVYHPWSIIGYNGFILNYADQLPGVNAIYDQRKKIINIVYGFKPSNGNQYIGKYTGVKLN